MGRMVRAAVLIPMLVLSGCGAYPGHEPDKRRFPESVPSGLLDFKPAVKSEDEVKQAVKPAAQPAIKPEQDAAEPSTEAVDQAPSEAQAGGELGIPVAQRLALSDMGATRLYSFTAMGQSLRLSLSQFAQVNNLNIIFDQDVAGVVNVEFRDVTLEQAMDAILDPIGLGWVQEDGMIRIVRQITKTYQVDYLRAARSGSNSMSASSSGGGMSGSNTISRSDSIDFWTELEAEIRSLLTRPNAEDGAGQPQTETTRTSKDEQNGAVTVTSRPIPQVEGRITINRLTGMVQITASPRLMKTIDAYMKNLIQGINRQVYIEARILDVALLDDSALGIDWSRITLGRSGSLTMSANNTITAAAGGASVLPATVAGTLSRVLPNGRLVSDIAATIQALEQQGTVRVLSQPRVRALNNQAAIMKVGTDRTFYTLKTTVTTPANGTPIQTTTEEGTKITEGVVLSVTPQISSEGYISLDVMPVINKIVGVDTSPTGNSNAARVETKQASTLLRLRDGETAVIGGLIMEEDSNTERRVPVLGAVPIAGTMFKGQYDNKVRKELVIFVTPHLIRD